VIFARLEYWCHIFHLAAATRPTLSSRNRECIHSIPLWSVA